MTGIVATGMVYPSVKSLNYMLYIGLALLIRNPCRMMQILIPKNQVAFKHEAQLLSLIAEALVQD